MLNFIKLHLMAYTFSIHWTNDGSSLAGVPPPHTSFCAIRGPRSVDLVDMQKREELGNSVFVDL